MGSQYRDNYKDSEIEAGEEIWRLLEDRKPLREVLEEYRTLTAGSTLDQACTLADTSAPVRYAYNMLDTAIDNIGAIYQLMQRNDPDEGDVMVMPISGVHILIRSALESAAIGFWILEPQNPKRIAHQGLVELLHDNHNWKKHLDETGSKVDRWTREREYLEGKLAHLNLPKAPDKPPQMTGRLQSIERANPWFPSRTTWLAIWQLCSGLAHGKAWPSYSVHFDVRQEDNPDLSTRSARLDVAAICLSATMNAIIVGVNRLVELSGAKATSKYKHPLPFRHATDPGMPTKDNWFMRDN